jgi:alpha-galactosidase
MNRSHFIRLSGSALGGLIFRLSPAGGDCGELRGGSIAPPARVFVLLDDGLHELSPSGGHDFVYGDLVVRLFPVEDVLRVEASSPSLPLKAVRLEWASAPMPAPDSVLGDAWERTYGDESFAPPAADRRLPWYFIGHSSSGAFCFGVKTGCRSLCYWQIGADGLSLTMDTRSGGVGVALGQRTLHLASVVATRDKEGESVFATGRRFCGLLCGSPRLAPAPVYGINDWYYAYGNNNPELIMRLTGLMTGLAPDTGNRPFSVVDAGWASYSPYHPGDGGWNDDFSRPNEKFKDMAKLAADILGEGMRPGLWMRPLCASYKDPANLLLPGIPGRDDPKSPVLDPSIPENLNRVGNNINLYRQWGYELVKHDYTSYDIFGKWGVQMTGDVTTPGWRFSDNSHTTAEIILGLYQTIRRAAGDLCLIGCNTMSHLSAGFFELMRVGDDTSGKEWARTRKMGVNTLGFRMIQHQRFYAADGDCVGLTRDVPWDKNKQWMELVTGSGTPLFISPQPEMIGDEQKAAIRAAFTLAARPLPAGEPLDWLTNPLPSRWRLNGEIREFDWS